MHWATQIIHDIDSQLKDNSNPLTTDLIDCGSDFLTGLRLTCCNVESSREILQQSITTAQCRLSSSATNSNTLGWRRLFTDASLIWTLCDIRDLSTSDHLEPIALECIARLDRAIIVAGPAGPGRLELILGVIERLQASCSLTVTLLDSINSSAFSADPSLLSSASGHVMCIDTAPSLAAFQSHLCQRPFILRGYASDWPALHERPWSSLSYLRSIAGPGRIVPVEVGSDYRSDDWSQTLMPWDDFLAYLACSSQSTQANVLYLAQHSLLTQFPALRRDIMVPDYVYACPVPTPDFPDYKPPGNEEQLVINVWLGPKGTISPAHTDPYFNVYVQIVGHKQIWLAPPQSSLFMYPYPTSTSASSDKAHNPAANTTNPFMSNTSQVDVFADHDRHRFPEFAKVVPTAISATLGPGDMMFFPPCWWHAMRSEDTSFSISTWF